MRSVMARSSTLEAAPAARGGFHFAMALAMMALVLVGFARTFFLRPLFDTYDVPRYVLVHGVAMTLWFVWYVAQTGLATRGRLEVHRRMGVIGAAIGVVAILSAVLVALGMVTRQRRSGRDIEADVALFADVMWSNMSSICTFAGFFVLALALRGRPDFHSRLMLLATIGLLSPALARAWVFPSFEVWPGMNINTLVFAHGCKLALPLALVIHDLVTARRPHPVTLVGIPSLFGTLALVQKVVPNTELGRSLILLL